VSTDNHDRPRTPVRVAALPQPGEDVWHPPQQDDPHHPAANGLVERLHHTVKVAIMCHADEQWTVAFPLVLLGIRTAYKEDLQSSAAELFYGEPLRVPGELLVPAAPKVEASTFIQLLRRHMDQLQPTPAARHASPATFIHKDLWDSTHVFLRQDDTRRALDPPYSGPQKVIARTDKTLTIVVRGWQVNVSADRVKPAYVLEGTRHDTGSPPAQPRNDTAKPVTTRPPQTTRSGRTIHFPARFTT
jgi:hypothetical protein